jgi:hypothetical protein
MRSLTNRKLKTPPSASWRGFVLWGATALNAAMVPIGRFRLIAEGSTPAAYELRHSDVGLA